ncbi:hypothetical protein Kpol_1032p31 [Vanderwaltozyma polyspora DSM 70294]|uniref:Inositolphosphotransferase Aur1/Ipt1 domain-containing protein n=1 Tax=Vanderwaltozyma polyspora (strain ATCC 22028 / DSM 70294 / BCRC 21397 / CBS 2163 / NBRC 10782 / NRRL Y-8283 / UCD 57-17) TaxID=436907 RepID=A7TGY6_VANPO|nr:uncharacterized protein Kpol_1032p31 [Vanderwaltozyma polyspora DSM 70294]EDO18438.1 hypothetical protein Kpol_1032p31 [Vanderwaltozyma polyspora DSM 70294]
MLLNIFKRLYTSATNRRNIFTLTINFFINFALILIWLEAFKHADLIPVEKRPKIHSHIAFYSDLFLFGDYWNEFKNQNLNNHSILRLYSFISSFSFMLILLVLLPLLLWYYIYHHKKIDYNFFERYDNYLHHSLELKFIPTIKRTFIFPFGIPLMTFIVLNLVHIGAIQEEENFTKFKDILSWVFYVLIHVIAPILTSIYLYVFHAPGTMKCFGIAVGVQNILGVTTHLLLPMAPPWFTHLYGINDTEHVNYSQEGFAAGLTRTDNHLGTHLSTDGFHKSPIVFGAVPSIHSALACQCVIFLLLRSTSLKHRFVTTSVHKRMLGITRNEDVEEHDEEMELEQYNGETPSSTPISSMREEYESDQEGHDDMSSTESFLAIDLESSSSISTDSSILTAVEDDFENNEIKSSQNFVQYYVEDITISKKWYFTIFNAGLVPKTLAIIFISIQWWSTMYLDHHYRFDLFIGMLYSLFSYTLINLTILQPRVMKNWIEIRLGMKNDDYNEGRTYGMRVFKGTNYEWFFDPLA